MHGAVVYPAATLLAVCAHLASLAQEPCVAAGGAPALDLADVRGQAHAKRALTIAAAGGHSLLIM